MLLPPGLVIAGFTSGSGQIGFAAELSGNRSVARFSVGSTQPGCWLLDPVMCGSGRIRALYAHGSRNADLAVITGTGGLFDARTTSGGPVEGTAPGSPAHVATLLGLPVVLLIDISGMSQTVGAVIRGITSMDTAVRITAVVLVGWTTDTHLQSCRAAVEAQGIPVLDDLDSVADLAERPAAGGGWGVGIGVDKHSPPPMIAVSTGTQPEWAHLLKATGAQVVEFDPQLERIPDCDGLIITGGHAPDLARHIASGKPLHVEGLAAWHLAEQLGLDTISGGDGAGLYREAVALGESLMFEAGQRIIGVEESQAIVADSPGWAPLWGWRTGTGMMREGFHRGPVSATCLRIHPMAVPRSIQRFARACADQVPQKVM